ncbi:MAG: hypothetical protein AABY05_01600 [Nanoarchaeota archaeon]
MNEVIVSNCRLLLEAYNSGKLGQTKMPEDSNPGFSEQEKEFRLAYFTLPMALNYQRNSYKLWEATLKTYNDKETKIVFDTSKVVKLEDSKLREYLTRYKVALQPNKHINTWKTIAKTVYDNFGSFENLIKKSDNDYLKLRGNIQINFKKGFPYLSGPKIFNYWSFIMKEYGKIPLKNADYIEIAPDTHVTQCSVLLGVITQDEAEKLSKDKISEKWREVLKGSGINPIDMHPPLWFWSRNGFIFKLK